jgi:SpoVK/Ycf46/Vps4 family AAA+-type ATPase
VAAQLAPVVLWIDEFEKGFAAVSQSESDAGLSKRIFGRLLAWLQDRPAPVFVVGRCNDTLGLPPELMRKGRFDEVFFVDLSGMEERSSIFTIHLRKRRRDPAAFDLVRLAAASQGFSGAEIEQAIVSALYAAFASGSDLTTDLIVRELECTHPLSVVRAEEVAALRAWASSRAVLAN